MTYVVILLYVLGVTMAYDLCTVIMLHTKRIWHEKESVKNAGRIVFSLAWPILALLTIIDYPKIRRQK